MPRSKSLQVLAGVVFLAATWAFWNSITSSDPLTEAREYAMAGEHELARKAWLQHLAARPGDHLTRFEFGEFLKPIDSTAALAEFQLIPVETPEYLPSRRHIAHLSILRGDDTTAEVELERLIVFSPDDLAIALSLAELYFRTKQFRKALPLVKHVIDLAPQRSESHLLLAEILDGLGRTPEMIPPLQQSLRLNANDYRVRSLLAFALHHSARLDEAEEHVQWCLRQRSDDAHIWRIMASISRDRGERTQALAQIRRAIQLQPDDVRCRILKADILLYDRLADDAWETLAPLRKTQRNNRDYLGALARAAALSGRLDEAKACQEVLKSLMNQNAVERPE